ncbi:hypothetical protein GQ44DRAFT_772732 [Phaeosphaeriaceae sp. PMI808]|nr:hypothetical protein GQ44DRAFT_772732 [Phaeosphaeriaceae sp. PMI808]
MACVSAAVALSGSIDMMSAHLFYDGVQRHINDCANILYRQTCTYPSETSSNLALICLPSSTSYSWPCPSSPWCLVLGCFALPPSIPLNLTIMTCFPCLLCLCIAAVHSVFASFAQLAADSPTFAGSWLVQNVRHVASVYQFPRLFPPRAFLAVPTSSEPLDSNSILTTNTAIPGRQPT